MAKNELPVKFSDEIAVYTKMEGIEIVVTNDRELADANEHLKGAKALRRQIREWFKKHKDKAREVLNGLIADERELINPLDGFIRKVEGKMIPYVEEKERQVREAEEAARRAAEEAERKERGAEEERQRKAREAMHDGDTKAAEEILAEPEPEIVPEPVDIPAAPELEDSHSSKRWTWEEQDIDKVPRLLPNGERALILNRGAITSYVQKHKDKAKVPGLRIFQKTGISTRL